MKKIVLGAVVLLLLTVVLCSCGNNSSRFTAEVTSLDGDVAEVSLIWSESGKLPESFSVKIHEAYGAEEGSIVDAEYKGKIKDGKLVCTEFHPSVRKNYDGERAEMTDENIENGKNYTSVVVVVREVYADCIVARNLYPFPYVYILYSDPEVIKTIHEGQQLSVEIVNCCVDEKNDIIEGDMLTQTESDIKLDPFKAYKPVIYFYPEKETDVSVSLPGARITSSYPLYKNGWNFTARPDGTLNMDGRNYYCLFWEGETFTDYKIDKGFCVKGSDTAAFLEDSLEKLGLSEREADEFIIYWLPLMENNAYNVISFDTAAYEKDFPLEVAPAPDTLIRVFMTWYGSENKVELPEETLISPKREGFTVVEWGGTEITK